MNSYLRRFLFSVVLSCACAGLLPAQEPELGNSNDGLPVFAETLASSVTVLPFKVIDLEFSRSRNAIVAVSDAPSQLHVYDPDSATWATVNLALAPTSVGVSPDGTKAIVGHSAAISYVDLAGPSLIKTLTVSGNPIDVVLGPLHAYVFAYDGYIRTVNLDTGVETPDYSWRTPAVTRMHPSLAKMYAADRNVSPADIMRINIVQGIADFAYDSVYHGDFSMCGDLWISRDGLRLFTACGNVFRASDDPGSDMRYAGKLSAETARISWVEHSQSGNNVAVLSGYSQYSYPPTPRTDNEIHYYTHDYLQYRGKFILPSFVDGSSTWRSRGRFVFFNADGTRQYVVVQADEASKLALDWGLVTIDCSDVVLSVNPASASVGAGDSTLQFQVTGASGCGWKAVSEASWLNTLTSGVGDGIVSLTVAANPGASPRTGTIRVGSAVYTVTQSAPVPTSVTATATSPASVGLTWSTAGTVDHWEVWRSSGGAWSMLGSSALASYTDSTAEAEKAYLYQVRAIVPGGEPTAFSIPDYAHTFPETSVFAGETAAAGPIQQLRGVVNAIRQTAGLEAIAFTDPSLPGAVPRRLHMIELRNALNAARTHLTMPPLTFSNLSQGSTLSAAGVVEVRNATR